MPGLEGATKLEPAKAEPTARPMAAGAAQPKPFRVDWCVMGSEAQYELAPPEAPGVEFVPAVSVSRNEWTARPEATAAWIREKLYTPRFLKKRPGVLLDDESADPRNNPAMMRSLQRFRDEVCEALRPDQAHDGFGTVADNCWADVSFYGPWEASAKAWQILSDQDRRDRQRENDSLTAMLKHCPAYCPSLYLQRPQPEEAALFNMREALRIKRRCDGQLGGLGPKHIRPVFSPFVGGEVWGGEVDMVELTRDLQVAKLTPGVDRITIWGWIDYPEVLRRWRNILPRLAAALAMALGSPSGADVAAGKAVEA